MDGARREKKRLRARILERDFRSSAPLLDEDGLPNWGGGVPLSVAAYTRLLDQDVPDADLSDEELEARNRLSPFREVFERLDETEEETVS